jgi:alkylation response protein AidB-like acyl-CoA dehydrogenase
VSQIISTDVVAAAQALVPHIRASRNEIEIERGLPASLVQKMARAGLFQLHLPRSMGGLECDPLSSVRVMETLAAAEGSVGWCASISSAISYLVARLPPQVGITLFGQPPDARLAGSLRPEGRSRRVEGGYRLSGRWDFASGVNHANWLYCSCVVEDDHGPCHTPEGIPMVRALMVPRDAVTVHDTWQVAGMRGTGSHDFEVDDMFVPHAHSLSVVDAVAHGGPLYHPRLLFIGAGAPTAGVALGLARGAIDTLRAMAANTASTMSTSALRDRPLVQRRVAEAEAMVGAARAYLLDALGQVWEAVTTDVPDPSAEVAQARLAMTHAMHESVKAVDRVFHAAGTNAVYEKNPLERYFRDVHVAVQHAVGRPEQFESAGKVLLGLRPDDVGW